jgi:hypothetical protein
MLDRTQQSRREACAEARDQRVALGVASVRERAQLRDWQADE